jgi:hypothetical protein
VGCPESDKRQAWTGTVMKVRQPFKFISDRLGGLDLGGTGNPSCGENRKYGIELRRNMELRSKCYVRWSASISRDWLRVRFG